MQEKWGVADLKIHRECIRKRTIMSNIIMIKISLGFIYELLLHTIYIRGKKIRNVETHSSCNDPTNYFIS